ncbi:MAG: hypothetical protein Q8S40_04835 [Falsiroseomonas sp.]|nr:hypothetical protein [Falsiroseomonas sp.]
MNDPAISIDIPSSSSFVVCELAGGEVRHDSPAIASARVSDFFLGATRVRRQYQDLIKSKEASSSSAWMVVTAYYCAFFAAIEIAKLFNYISISLASEDLKALSIKATGASHSAFFSSGNNNFIGQPHAGKLVFSSIGTRPHVVAWQNALRFTKTAFKKKDWIDASHYITALQENDCSPSAVRNEWNYKRSDYYGAVGDARASEFKKLVGNPKSAHNFLCRTRGLFSNFDPCLVAVLCEVFNSAITQSHARATEIIRNTRN